MPSASVTMFVINSCVRDARVLKEAGSLAAAGYSVRVIATLDATTTPHETRDGFVIDRVRGPVHRRLIRRVVSGFRVHRGSVRAATRRAAPGLCDGHTLLTERRMAAQAQDAGVATTHRRRACARRGCGEDGLLSRTRMAMRSARSGTVNVARGCLLPIHRAVCHFDYCLRARWLARQAPSEIYHGHDLNALLAAWWSRRALGGKLIYDSHEIYAEMSGLRWLERKVAKVVERYLIRRVDAVITIHNTAADELSRRYGVAKPAVVKNCPRIPLGCNRTTRLKDAIGLADSDLIVLYQGGFMANRGLPNLVRAMTHLPESAKLVMMGWGRIEPELRVLAEELGLLDHRVFFLPPVPQGELLHWTASADVGVIPYQAVGLNNYLCMPNKLFEYMGAGLPVVASAFPELSRIIVANEIGLTFDPEDPKSIASAIGAVLGDRELRDRMSENARTASRVYNWENEEKSLLAVYAKVIA